MDLVRIIIAIFLPPVAAFLTVGIGLHFWLNILLTILGFLPGMIHALWLVVKKND
ncbi:MAG: YqaE/Pmp3 family membrane protein [Alphaproteobacteria bacterium]